MTTAGFLADDRRAGGRRDDTGTTDRQSRGDCVEQANLQHPRLSANNTSQQEPDSSTVHGQICFQRTNKASNMQPTRFQGDNNIQPSAILQTDQRARKRDSNQLKLRAFSIDDDIANNGSMSHARQDNYDNSSDEDDDDESSEATLAVASAEEYAAKIIKLQQACLIPLKEDLADWLNKILKTFDITTENFMDTLDNGVVICRLAKIISLWCEQRLANTEITSKVQPKSADAEDFERKFSAISPFANPTGPLRSTTSQSINCLTTSASATSLNNNALSYQRRSRSNQFLNSLIKMHQTKIWEDAKCRTFYARDNVCNFIKWCKDFGVNQSVLFESDDLVLHANPRQVVLCLLDVARIAYVKHDFTEAPGLVKFEQGIDKELALEKNCALNQDVHESDTIKVNGPTQNGVNKQSAGLDTNKKSIRARKSLDLPIDRTDELVMRYCRHKEEEAARKRNEELEIAAAVATEAAAAATAIESGGLSLSDQALTSLTKRETGQVSRDSLEIHQPDKTMPPDTKETDIAVDADSPEPPIDRNIEVDSLLPLSEKEYCIQLDDSHAVSSTTCDNEQAHKIIVESDRIDSLDSGELPTESVSTGHSSSRTPMSRLTPRSGSSIPVPKKRAFFTSSAASQRALSMTNSELSSSRSSLFSNPEGNSTSISQYGRTITSDLDVKVMRIAKSYYGKKATKDVTRLSEGKYKIADRIVFVRLLKGHRVMVRIGGGWDTLENFLFRHKSDPSQVIDPDNLLPLETKMPFDKSPQVTPTKSSRLPYYRRSNSASSTNLSLSKLSVSCGKAINLN